LSNEFEVTAIVPTIGRINLLEQALMSLSAQTLPVSQILVIPDGVDSTSLEHIQEMTTRFHNVEVHPLLENSGVSAARNLGLNHAKGEYVLFLDDDDLLHPDWIRQAMNVFSADFPVDVAVCLYEVIFTPSALSGHPGIFPFDYKLHQDHPLRPFDKANFCRKQEIEDTPTSAFLRYLIPVNSCIVKQSAIGETRFSEDLSQGEDTFFWLNLAWKGCKFHLTEETYAYVRRHGENTTRSVSDYAREIPRCYIKIQSSDQLTSKDDIFLVKLKLFYFSWKLNPISSLPGLLGLLRYPGLLVHELSKFLRETIRDRRRLLKYYFSD
jgi:glycosyltransferase involved in cell wall biosynthesis